MPSALTRRRLLRRTAVTRHRAIIRLVTAAAAGAALAATGGCADDFAGDGAPEAEIVRVIDGDTIDVRLADGTRQRVRLIGIDAPESTTLRSGSAECGGAEATQATRALARRSPRVALTTDPGQDAYDQYDRLLAYVTPEAPDGASDETFQESLLAQGWVRVYVFRQDPFSRVDEFRAAASEARAAGRGVWRACGGDFRRALAPPR